MIVKGPYLTEDLLFDFLNAVFPNTEIIRDKSIKNSGIQNRPDFHIPSRNLIVEFDGARHYTSSSQ